MSAAATFDPHSSRRDSSIEAQGVTLSAFVPQGQLHRSPGRDVDPYSSRRKLIEAQGVTLLRFGRTARSSRA